MFETVLDSSLRHAHRVLIFGAGRGVFERDLRAQGRRVVGIDVTGAVSHNPYLDEAVIYGGTGLPFETAAFDLCVERWVIEHLPDPVLSFREISRVVQPGGRFVFLTTNAWFYGSLVARVTPNTLHGRIVKWATGRAVHDTFKTYYRANTRGRLRRILRPLGFQEEYLRVELEDPAYLQFSVITYVLGVAYERVVTSVPWLEDLGQAITGSFLRR